MLNIIYTSNNISLSIDYDEKLIYRIDFIHKNLNDNHSNVYIILPIHIKLLLEEFDKYFDNKVPDFSKIFSYLVDLTSNFTPFQITILNIIKNISYGKNMSYKEIAYLIGNPKSYRAVANACGRNPFVILYPCHRVLGSNGYIGGFSGGIEFKIKLLKLENMI